MTRDKFTNLLKSISPRGVAFWLFILRDHRKWLLALKGKGELLEKARKRSEIFFKKYQTLFTDFSLLACGFYSHFEFKLKKWWYHIYRIWNSTMIKLNPITTSFAGPSLTKVRFKWRNVVMKMKKPLFLWLWW